MMKMGEEEKKSWIKDRNKKMSKIWVQIGLVEQTWHLRFGELVDKTGVEL